MENKNKIINNLKYHLSDSTAIMAEAIPVFAAFETKIAGMANDVSINAKFLAAGLCYSGLGWVYGKGRDVWRKFFNITPLTSEKIQYLNDMVYTGLFNVVATPPMYIVSGARDLNEIVIGTACAVGFGAINGAPMGYIVDVFRDLTGLEDCERESYPDFLKKRTPKVKKAIAAGLIAVSIGIAGLIYTTNDNKTSKKYINKPAIEQTIQKQNYQNNSLENIADNK